MADPLDEQTEAPRRKLSGPEYAEHVPRRPPPDMYASEGRGPPQQLTPFENATGRIAPGREQMPIGAEMRRDELEEEFPELGRYDANEIALRAPLSPGKVWGRTAAEVIGGAAASRIPGSRVGTRVLGPAVKELLSRQGLKYAGAEALTGAAGATAGAAIVGAEAEELPTTFGYNVLGEAGGRLLTHGASKVWAALPLTRKWTQRWAAKFKPGGETAYGELVGKGALPPADVLIESSLIEEMGAMARAGVLSSHKMEAADRIAGRAATAELEKIATNLAGRSGKLEAGLVVQEAIQGSDRIFKIAGKAKRGALIEGAGEARVVDFGRTLHQADQIERLNRLGLDDGGVNRLLEGVRQPGTSEFTEQTLRRVKVPSSMFDGAPVGATRPRASLRPAPAGQTWETPPIKPGGSAYAPHMPLERTATPGGGSRVGTDQGVRGFQSTGRSRTGRMETWEMGPPTREQAAAAKTTVNMRGAQPGTFEEGMTLWSDLNEKAAANTPSGRAAKQLADTLEADLHHAADRRGGQFLTDFESVVAFEKGGAEPFNKALLGKFITAADPKVIGDALDGRSAATLREMRQLVEREMGAGRADPRTWHSAQSYWLLGRFGDATTGELDRVISGNKLLKELRVADRNGTFAEIIPNTVERDNIKKWATVLAAVERTNLEGFGSVAIRLTQFGAAMNIATAPIRAGDNENWLSTGSGTGGVAGSVGILLAPLAFAAAMRSPRFVRAMVEGSIAKPGSRGALQAASRIVAAVSEMKANGLITDEDVKFEGPGAEMAMNFYDETRKRGNAAPPSLNEARRSPNLTAPLRPPTIPK